MIKIIEKLKRDKLQFAIAIVFVIVSFLDLFLIIFDLVQFILISNNASLLGSGFLCINIIFGILNLICFALFVIYIIIYKRSTNSKTKKIKK